MDKSKAVEIGKRLAKLGYKIVATHGTAKTLEAAGVKCQSVNKVREGRPHIVDMLKNSEIDLVINTTEGAEAIADSFSIRSTSLTQKIPYTTTITGGAAISLAMESLHKNPLTVTPLQSYA